MQTLWSVEGQRLNNRTINFSNMSATLASGWFVMFRLRLIEVNEGASITINMDITHPNGVTKNYQLAADAVGSYQRGGWAGEHLGGDVTASGTIVVSGRITVDAYVVAFEYIEDVPEWL